MIQNLIYSQPNNYYQANNAYDRLNNLMNTDMNQIHSMYYPDLTNDEFNANMQTRNKLLYERGKLEQLAKYGDRTNCGILYNKIKGNQDFKEIINSKYIDNPQMFVRLINNLNSLEHQRQEKFIPYNYPYMYGGIYYNSVQRPIDYNKYNMNDYLKMLNDFIKNDKISDDLKQYFISMKSDKIDLYYSKLDKLNLSDNPMEVLMEKIYRVQE